MVIEACDELQYTVCDIFKSHGKPNAKCNFDRIDEEVGDIVVSPIQDCVVVNMLSHLI